jgi:hypothetical protein
MRSGGVSAAELVERDPASWVVGVGDAAEAPVAFVVGRVDLALSGFRVGLTVSAWH